MTTPRYYGRSLCTFLAVLLLMPLGHALMILMEHFMDETTLHYSGFAMGAVGMAAVVAGVFVRHDLKATLLGLVGGLLFWTGWVEFLFGYYAWRFGVHFDLLGTGLVESATQYADGLAVGHSMAIDGVPVDQFSRHDLKAIRGSRPEYLIMPATFGMWMMVMMLYLFCTTTGCRLFSWLQRTCRIRTRVALRPMTHLPAMVTFMETNLMLWSLYLLLMFCYDPVFLGPSHIVTCLIAVGCLVGFCFMFARQARIKAWGPNLRMAVASVLVLWTFVEIMGRNGLLREIWIDPLAHLPHLSLMLLLLVLLPLIPLLRQFFPKPAKD